MNYYMDLTGAMNIRKTADPNGVWIQTLPAGTRVEGDRLFKDAAGRDWLEVLLIGAVQTTQPTYIATYTSNGVLKTNPVVPDPLPFQVGLNIVADSPLQLSRVNADGTKTLLFSADVGEYVIAFIANDSNRPFIRME